MHSSFTRWHTIAALVVAAFVGALVGAVAFAQDSGAQSDQAFTPITPCAVFDTRNGLGGTTGAQVSGSVTTYFVSGISTCPDIPLDASAIELNLVAVSPQAGGNLRVAPRGFTPGGGVVNYTTGQNNSNAVTVGIDSGRIDVHVNGGTTHIRGVILGYYTIDLEQRVADLEAKLDEVSALLAGFSRETVDGFDTVRLTDANLQLVDGTGTTYGGTSGTGNLIVGYHFDVNGVGGQRTGTHNIVVGNDHGYLGSGNVLFGFSSFVSGDASSITGGVDGNVSSFAGSISGGSNNQVTGDRGAVGGGAGNQATAEGTFVAGGSINEAEARGATVIGGSGNDAGGNNPTGEFSTVVGGTDNLATGVAATVVGGDSNTATGPTANITGGQGNVASGENSTVSGGRGRTVTGPNDWRAGDLFETN